MSEQKHTPGPWDVKTRDEWEGGYDFFSGPDGAFTFMADVDQEDARLISAAPDMLEALKMALNFLENTESELGITLESADMARSAISKALTP